MDAASLPTLQVWRWALSMRRPEAAKLRQLREQAKREPLARRLGVFSVWLASSLVLFFMLFLVAAAPLEAIQNERLARCLVVPWGLCSILLGFAAGSIVTAWLVRRFELLSEPALEYLLRRGFF
jgi:hypothetical protein